MEIQSDVPIPMGLWVSTYPVQSIHANAPLKSSRPQRISLLSSVQGGRSEIQNAEQELTR
jgi:hypothetical protein